MLIWAREHGCTWDEMTCAKAAEGGHLEVLKWAREHGCPLEEDEPTSHQYDNEDATWGVQCCALAAKGGHLEVLKWLRFGSNDGEDETACPWDEWTCAYAALRAGTWRC